MTKTDWIVIFWIFTFVADICCSMILRRMERRERFRKEDFSTKELVEELKKREGVATEIVEPYAAFSCTCNGPATVLTIFD